MENLILDLAAGFKHDCVGVLLVMYYFERFLLLLPQYKHKKNNYK